MSVTMMSAMKVPADTDAESACLGSMMLSSGATEVGVQRLVSADFYKPQHAAVFAGIVECYRSGQFPDPVAVSAACAGLGNLKQAGELRGVMAIQATTPASANMDAYVDIVIDRADRRRIIAVSDQMRNKAEDTTVDLDEIVSDATVGVADVQRASGPRTHPSYSTWRDGIDMRERWIIPAILEHRDRVVLVAREGLGKSHLLRQWALMAACGVHWFSERRMPARKTLLIDVENSPRQIRRNTEAMWARAQRCAPGFDEDNFVVIPYSQLDITRRADRLDVESYFAGHRPDLVVIGPLYKIMPPPTHKVNYEEAALRGIAVIDDWRARYDIAVLMEHHAPKSSAEPLGSSAWMRWPEYGITLDVDKENPMVANLGHFRGQREQRPWPKQIERVTHGGWQWRAVPGSYVDPDEERY